MTKREISELELELLRHKFAIRDIRHTLAEYYPADSRKWMNATPHEVAEQVVLVLAVLQARNEIE